MIEKETVVVDPGWLEDHTGTSLDASLDPHRRLALAVLNRAYWEYAHAALEMARLKRQRHSPVAKLLALKQQRRELKTFLLSVSCWHRYIEASDPEEELLRPEWLARGLRRIDKAPRDFLGASTMTLGDR